MKKTLLLLAGAALLFGAAPVTAADAAPKSVIHVVSVKWKAEATPEQITAALDGVHVLTEAFPGITRVWTKAFKVQGDWSTVFVMEFKDEQALKDYSGSDAQKEWYRAYLPIRQMSNTHDITN